MISILNLDNVDEIILNGLRFGPSEEHNIDERYLIDWANDDEVLQAISNGSIQVRVSGSDIDGVSNQINVLKKFDPIQKDSEGAPIQRPKLAPTGWQYQFRTVEFKTSKMDSIYSKDINNSDIGDCAIKYYKDVSGVETEITGGDLNDTFLQANCIRTDLDIEPPYNIEVIGGVLRQNVSPSSDVRLWVVAVPDVPYANGGEKVFAQGGFNLRSLGAKEGLYVDGRVSKKLIYSDVYHSNKIRIIIRHDIGLQHTIQMTYELFRP